jgi:hypothetical protein
MKGALMKTFQKHLVPLFIFASMGVIQDAAAASTSQLECQFVGVSNQERIDDQPDHMLGTSSYSCRAASGPLSGAVYTGNNITEWTGSTGKYVSGSAVHRFAGGILVSIITSGTLDYIMSNGQPVGFTAKGKGRIAVASGSAASLAGSLFTFTAKTTGFNQFRILVTHP